MTEIESQHIRVKAPVNRVFSFLRDLNNFKQLLPQDRITDWSSDRDNCRFRVNNMATIELVYKSEEANKSIHIASGAKSPFPFTLTIHINDHTGEIEVYNVFKGEMNPVLRMMAEQPLRNLFNYIATEVGKVNFEN
jgi:carbon monoxide dehydrogenase subunit G